MLGAQFAVELNRNFHVLATAGWTHGHNTFTLASNRTNIWQYDAGVEANLVRPLANQWLPILVVGLVVVAGGELDTLLDRVTQRRLG